MSAKLEVLDLIIQTLRAHEEELDRLVHVLKELAEKPESRGQQLNDTERRYYENL